MNPVLKNILAVVVGLVVGGVVNSGIIMLGGAIVSPPPGIDPMDVESIRAGMEAGLYSPQHFIVPFLAHALGTLVGAFLAARIAANRKMIFALSIGVLFLIGGIIAATMLPAPAWFVVLDLVVAYIPMAWLGGILAAGRNPSTVERAM